MHNISTEKFIELLKNNKKFDPVYGEQSFSNHLSMALIALFFMDARSNKHCPKYKSYIEYRLTAALGSNILLKVKS